MIHSQAAIKEISGTVVTVRGDDIDTDRIIPARFLKCTVFDELGPRAFEDDRLQLKDKGQIHPFDMPHFQGSSILVVNKNFGCGSSREHAPQSLMRWGIKAIVGESFAEIFFGNCVSLGIPCTVLPEAGIADLMTRVEANPSATWRIDIEKRELTGEKTYALNISNGVRDQFLKGGWNPMEALLRNGEAIKQLERQLPYRFA